MKKMSVIIFVVASLTMGPGWAQETGNTVVNAAVNAAGNAPNMNIENENIDDEYADENWDNEEENWDNGEINDEGYAEDDEEYYGSENDMVANEEATDELENMDQANSIAPPVTNNAVGK